jgi:hypothetical protein
MYVFLLSPEGPYFSNPAQKCLLKICNFLEISSPLDIAQSFCRRIAEKIAQAAINKQTTFFVI